MSNFETKINSKIKLLEEKRTGLVYKCRDYWQANQDSLFYKSVKKKHHAMSEPELKGKVDTAYVELRLFQDRISEEFAEIEAQIKILRELIGTNCYKFTKEQI